MSQLIIYCLEDTVFEAEKGEFVANRETLSLAGAHRLLLELGQRGGGEGVGEDGLVPQLDYCAKSRVALSTVAVLLHEVLAKRKVPHADRVMASAADLVQGSPFRGAMRRYFVRSLVALFRKDLVFEWKESGVLPELMPEEIRDAIIQHYFLLFSSNTSSANHAVNIFKQCH